MVEIFAEVSCPFTHAWLRRLLVHAGEADLRIRAWPLELVDGEPLSPALVTEEIDALRRDVDPASFAGFDPAHFPATSLPALALAAAAYELGPEPGTRVSLALRHALFGEGRDIADGAVLAAIGAAHGVAPPTARHDATVLAEWEDGRRRGVEGSPHVFDGTSSLFAPGLDVKQVDGRFEVSLTDWTPADPSSL